MLWKSLFKSPMLTIGILMMGLFILQVAREEQWGGNKFESTSCKGAIVRLAKKVPGNWKVFCEGNNLAVEIRELAIPEKATNLNTLMYRQLANHMSFVAKTAPPDLLERIDFARFRIQHPRLEINAVTEGKYLVKLNTLETPEHIMTHLKATVQVQEKKLKSL